MKTICQWIGTSVPGILLSRGQTFGVALASSIDTYYFFFIFFCVYMFFVFMFFVVIINWCILFVCFTLALYEKTNESEVDVQHLTFIFSPSISLRFHQCVKQMTWSENKIIGSLDFFHCTVIVKSQVYSRLYSISKREIWSLCITRNNLPSRNLSLPLCCCFCMDCIPPCSIQALIRVILT